MRLKLRTCIADNIIGLRHGHHDAMNFDVAHKVAKKLEHAYAKESS